MCVCGYGSLYACICTHALEHVYIVVAMNSDQWIAPRMLQYFSKHTGMTSDEVYVCVWLWFVVCMHLYTQESAL